MNNITCVSESLLYTILNQEPKSVKERWKAVDGDRFIKLRVDTVSRLDTFVKSRQLEYKSGCFFFELLADDVDVERISDNQEVVIMNEVVYTTL